MYRKGQKVTLILDGAGTSSQEEATIGRIAKDEIWLDNGPGNRPIGPFDSITGEYQGYTIAGFQMRLQILKNVP